MKCIDCGTELTQEKGKHKIILWFCNDCKKLYPTYKEAENCENSHKDTWNLAVAIKIQEGTMTDDFKTFIQKVKEDVSELPYSGKIKEILDKRAGDLR